MTEVEAEQTSNAPATHGHARRNKCGRTSRAELILPADRPPSFIFIQVTLGGQRAARARRASRGRNAPRGIQLSDLSTQLPRVTGFPM
ncbi:hypothetical protein GN956_G13710 [Arapaima gigas]